MADGDRTAAGVLGFEYVPATSVRMTPAQWRDKYPPAQFRRVAEDGQTSYHSLRTKDARGEWVEARCVAEAYAIIPAGK